MAACEKLIAKHYQLTPRQVEKIERLAKERGVSASAIVRWAIDAHDGPEEALIEAELLALAAARVKEAIADTRATNLRVEESLSKMMR